MKEFREMSKNLLSSKIQFYSREISLKTHTVIAFFYDSLNSELIRYSQFYDISVSNEPTERAAQNILCAIHPNRSSRIACTRVHVLESSCAMLRYSRWSLSSSGARWHQGQAAQDFSQWERWVHREEESERTSQTKKRAPSLTAWPGSIASRTSRCLIFQKTVRSFSHPPLPHGYIIPDRGGGPPQDSLSSYVPPPLVSICLPRSPGVSPGR